MVGAGARGAPLLPPVLLLPLLLRGAAGGIADSVVWAVNAGGDAHVDVNGIHFRKDPLEGRVGRGEGGGHAAAGGFRRDSPRSPARLRSAGAARPRCAGGVRDPRAPGAVLPAAAPAGRWLSPQDGGGSSPPAARGRSWPEGSTSGTVARVLPLLPPGPAAAAAPVPVAVRARGPRGGGMSPAGWCACPRPAGLCNAGGEVAPRALEWDFGWKGGGSGQAASPAAFARRSLFLSRFPLKSPCFTAGSASSQLSAQRARCSANKLFQPSAAGSGSRTVWVDACSILVPTAKSTGCLLEPRCWARHGEGAAGSSAPCPSHGWVFKGRDTSRSRGRWEIIGCSN